MKTKELGRRQEWNPFELLLAYTRKYGIGVNESQENLSGELTARAVWKGWQGKR